MQIVRYHEPKYWLIISQILCNVAQGYFIFVGASRTGFQSETAVVFFLAGFFLLVQLLNDLNRRIAMQSLMLQHTLSAHISDAILVLVFVSCICQNHNFVVICPGIIIGILASNALTAVIAPQFNAQLQQLPTQHRRPAQPAIGKTIVVSHHKLNDEKWQF